MKASSGVTQAEQGLGSKFAAWKWQNDNYSSGTGNKASKKVVSTARKRRRRPSSHLNGTVGVKELARRTVRIPVNEAKEELRKRCVDEAKTILQVRRNAQNCAMSVNRLRSSVSFIWVCCDGNRKAAKGVNGENWSTHWWRAIINYTLIDGLEGSSIGRPELIFFPRLRRPGVCAIAGSDVHLQFYRRIF